VGTLEDPNEGNGALIIRIPYDNTKGEHYKVNRIDEFPNFNKHVLRKTLRKSNRPVN